MFVDQHGDAWSARTVQELRRKIGGRISPMYVDKLDGRTVKVGYVVGRLWCREYRAVEVEVG